MKSVLISINPKWCELIASGKKTIEVRKTRPKCDMPFKCYIYCTKGFKPNTKYGYKLWAGRGKVIGEFVCDKIYEYTAEFVDNDRYEDIRQVWDNEDYLCEIDKEFKIITSNEKEQPDDCDLCKNSCLTFEDIKKYIGVNFHDTPFYGWHISDLVVYDKPKELHEFYKCGILSYDEWLYGIYNGKGGATLSYESYKNVFKLNRPPQSWSYVEDVSIAR